MKKAYTIASFLAVAFIACAGVAPVASASGDAVIPSAAPGADIRPGETPLMVIRFNDAHIAYQLPLYDTLSKALKAKPSAMFEIVSVAPKARNPDNQPKYDQVASRNTGKVLTTIHQMGMPESRLSLISASDNVRSTEVRIYIR